LRGGTVGAARCVGEVGLDEERDSVVEGRGDEVAGETALVGGVVGVEVGDESAL
jgi:hypothetical protein